MKRNLTSRRGSIMILTLFILTLLAMMGAGFMLLVPVEMRNAKQDREIMQAGFAADAALKVVLDQLYHDVPYDQIVLNSPQVMSGSWKYQVESIEEIEEEVYRVTTAGMLGDKVKRRAVAVVDNGSGKFAVSFTSASTDSLQDINSQGGWPVNVPIHGDVYVQGTWHVDNTGLDLNAPNADRPFKGYIFQADPGGTGLRGENYTGTTPSNATQYAAMYDYGIDAVQRYDPEKIKEESLLVRDEMHSRLLKLAFAVDTDAQLQSSLANANGLIHVGDPDFDGNLDGGFFVPNAGSVRNFDSDIKYSYNKGARTGTTEILDKNGNTITLTSKKGGNSNSSQYPDTIQVSTVNSSKTYNCNLEDGYVLYIDGSVAHIEGTYLGNQTVAASRGITISGELLKSDTPRGEEPDGSTDALGLMACVNGDANDPGMSVNMTSVPPDNEYFIYAHMTTFSPGDNNAKMFSQNQHPSLPAGTTLTLIGAISWAPTTAGHINTAMDYIAQWKEVIIDSEKPIGFPTGGNYIPRVRSYVDIPVGE